MSQSTVRKPIKRKKKPATALSARPAIIIAASVGMRYVVFLESMLHKVVALIPDMPQEISIALVNDAKMSALHLQFLNIAGPTDVLTFELDHDDAGKMISGEIVLCVPEARRRSRDLGHKIENELLLYAIHGILHLSGYDDRTDAAYRRMHQAEDHILTQLGIGAVFAVKQSV